MQLEGHWVAFGTTVTPGKDRRHAEAGGSVATGGAGLLSHWHVGAVLVVDSSF